MKKISSKPLPNLSTLKKRYIQEPYDAVVNVYHKKHFDEKVFNVPITEFSSMLKSGDLVLDAGCGTGGETKKLIVPGFKVKSIDISEGMLRKAKLVVPLGDFQKMDIMNLTFPSNYFDGIWSARALIHIPSPELGKVLDGFSRILKEGGIACLIVIKGEGEGIEPEDYDKTGKTSTFFRYFKEGELEKEVISCGFKVIKSEKIQKDEETYLVVFARKERG